MDDWITTKTLSSMDSVKELSKSDFSIEEILKEKIRIIDLRILKSGDIAEQIILIKLQLSIINTLQKEQDREKKITSIKLYDFIENKV
jgi:hypothetical protein